MSSSDTEVHGWELFFRELLAFLETCSRHSGIANRQLTEYIIERLETAIHAVVHVEGVLQEGIDNNIGDVFFLQDIIDQLSHLEDSLQALYTEWESYLDTFDRLTSMTTSYSVPLETSNGPRARGRPRFDVRPEQIAYLRSMSFTYSQIADLLGVSRMTVYRRCSEFSVTDLRSRENRMSDTDVNRIVREIRLEHHSLGETMVMGRLQSMRCNVTREQVRQAIRASDPLHTALRSPSAAISRQPYSVPGPNSLWHIGKLVGMLTVQKNSQIPVCMYVSYD